MSEASLAAQRLAVTAMRARTALTSLVPAAAIFDRNGKPSVFPSVIIGEAQTVGEDIDCGDLSEVYLTVHAWATSPDLGSVKLIAGEVRRSLRRLEGLQDGFELDFYFEDSRFFRDPDGEHTHAVLSFKVAATDMSEVA